MLDDLRYAVRLLLKNPSVTIVAISCARARDRSEHRHLQRDQCGVVAAAALSGCGRTDFAPRTLRPYVRVAVGRLYELARLARQSEQLCRSCTR